MKFRHASLAGKLRMLSDMKPLFQSAKAISALEQIPALHELLTAPSTKILNNWFESEPLKATLATDACIGAMVRIPQLILGRDLL